MVHSPSDTHYASPGRQEPEMLRIAFERLREMEHLQDMIDAMPMVSAILNEDRQIIFANKTLLDGLDTPIIDTVLGKRPGELINCMHASDMPGGCGTSEACRYCGAVQAITLCQQQQKKVSLECRITGKKAGEEVSYDFQATATPFSSHDNGRYVLFSLTDISHQKRRRTLERIFFHDVINTAGSLNGFMEILEENDDLDEIKQDLHMAKEISRNLLSEILAQRTLLAAEHDELMLDRKPVSCRKAVETAAEEIGHHAVAHDKDLRIQAGPDAILHTDGILLNRILVNMIKNAMEATSARGTVTAGCRVQEGEVIFWVHNPSFIPRKVQMQIFQRSFSTKGKDRGLGTYSMKLLGEKYLQGRVSFETSEAEGTHFFFAHPISQQE